MTSDLCTDDVVVHITTPQTISCEAAVSGSCPVGGAGGAARAASSSAAVELGRRLLLAARAGDTALVLDLMAKGAPFTTDWLGTSPLHLAAAGGHVETCAVLLRAGVSRDARTKVDRAALHVAASHGHALVVRLLLEAGGGPHARDMLRMTPLHWAVQHGDTATVVELLSHGADPSAVSKFNKTPRSLAAELHREDLVKLMDDALREREAEHSVQQLVNEQNMTETPVEQTPLQQFDGIQRLQNIKTYKIKSEKEKTPKIEIKSEQAVSEGAGAQLLRRHGITLLPPDHSSTVLSALQSGRTVVLSDAGKLMLKESSESREPVVPKSPAPVAPVNTNMVLTATPVKSPPKAGIKIFTLNNKLITKQKDHNKIPVKKIINPQDMQQVKLVQLSADAKLFPSSKLKSVSRSSGAGARPALKIIMNKSKLSRVIQSAAHTEHTTRPEQAEEAAGLRAALAASRRAVTALQHELTLTRARLARYEDIHQP